MGCQFSVSKILELFTSNNHKNSASHTPIETTNNVCSKTQSLEPVDRDNWRQQQTSRPK